MTPSDREDQTSGRQDPPRRRDLGSMGTPVPSDQSDEGPLADEHPREPGRGQPS